jgi:hypothetical protein
VRLRWSSSYISSAADLAWTCGAALEAVGSLTLTLAAVTARSVSLISSLIHVRTHTVITGCHWALSRSDRSTWSIRDGDPTSRQRKARDHLAVLCANRAAIRVGCYLAQARILAFSRSNSAAVMTPRSRRSASLANWSAELSELAACWT